MQSTPPPDISDPLFSEFPPTSTDEWDAKIEEDLRGADYDKLLVWDSIEGVTLQPYYREADRHEVAHRDAMPLVDVDDAPANQWRLRQDISNADLQEARSHAQRALDRGATDLGFVVQPRKGRLHGVPIQTQDDMDALLEDLPLEDAPIHFSTGAAGLPLLAMLLNTADRQGLSGTDLSGSIDYDPAAALEQGTLNDAKRAYDYAAPLASFSKENGNFHPLAIDMRPYHSAGASVVQELAFTLASLSEMLAQATERDVAPQTVCDALHGVVPIGTSFFMEIGKLRALRLLIPQVLAAYDVDDATLPLHAVTARREQTIYDPHVNMLRTTTAATAAVIGGCDMLTVRPFDAEFEAPNDFSYRIARNTQLILKHESHFDFVADPAAGSYYVEQLTDQLGEKAWALFQEVEAQGGLLEVLRNGWIHQQIQAVRTTRRREIAEGRRTLVGTNHYPKLDETKRNPESERAKSTPLQQTKVDIDLTGEMLLLPAMRRALDEVATLGDVLKALRGTDDSTIEPLSEYRSGESFEALRLRTEQYAEEHGGAPTVFLVPVGHPSWRSARANFARNFFGVAGFQIEENLRFDSPEEGAQAALKADSDIVVVCSSDAEYAEVVPAICSHLREASADALVVVAGYPSDQIEALEAAGVDGFIHKRSPLLDTLEDYQQRLGID